MKKPVVIGLAVVVLAAVVAGGYWWYQSRQDNGLTLYGNVDIRTVNLSFRVGGRVESLAVDEGDAIKAGQVLGELDHKPYEIALMQAKAGVSVAQAQYDLMLAGYRDEEIAQAAAAVKQAQAAYDYAQNFYNRQQGLWKSRTISANDLENARSSRDQAQAWLQFKGYEPTTLRLGPLTRMGGRVGSANIAFDDHPNEKRFSDRIETVTVDSVLAWMQRTQLAAAPVVLAIKN